YSPLGEKEGAAFWKAQISSCTIVLICLVLRSISFTSSRPLKKTPLLRDVSKAMSRLDCASRVSCVAAPLPSAGTVYQLRYPWYVWLNNKVLLSSSHFASETRSPDE